MIEILENYDLTKLNTFGVGVTTKFFTEVKNEAELLEILNLSIFRNNEKLFLGGGSNVLFTHDFEGFVILNKIKGIEVLNENEESVWVKFMSGEVWQDAVLFTVASGLWGIENLALIPGTVGAAPMQNIGAYGAELKDTLESVEAIDISTGEKRTFTNRECEFGYRDSIFKNEFKGRFFILSITLRLSKDERKNIEYKVLKQYLEENKISPDTSKIISEAVSEIRRSKLPDPKVIGNAGSFFKNVFIGHDKLEDLLKKYPELPYFTETESIKIPSAWLIEQCGWKGKRLGNVGVHDKQALVLVNHGGGTGEEIKSLAEQIISSVYEKFGIKLTQEVNLI
ncbi:MAG: UDP-N-acetylmuramate dehydrogenase [bacterium]|nr:UDP-N-acetylmuramate dehydrogenase [bacterium]